MRRILHEIKNDTVKCDYFVPTNIDGNCINDATIFFLEELPGMNHVARCSRHLIDSSLRKWKRASKEEYVVATIMKQ